jgi:Na+/proline symporter
VWEILAVAFLAAILVSMLAPRLFRRSPGAGAGAGSLSGTLLITGVSPKPDATGRQYVTITGVIDGPTVSDFTVYQRMVVDVDRWPSIGELKPVVYSERNPEKWAFAPAEPPPLPEDPPAE